MFKDYLKAWFNYRNDDNVMSLRTLTTLKTEIQQDLFDAFEMVEPVIREHSDLFDTSSSFVDFLFRLLDVSPPKQSFVKKDSDTIQGKLDTINASLNDIMSEHKRLIGEVDKTYKTNKDAFAKGEEILTTNLGQLTAIVAEFNEHFQKIKQMTDKFKQKFQAIECPEKTQNGTAQSITFDEAPSSPSMGDPKKIAIPLSDSGTDAEQTIPQSELEECRRNLDEKQDAYDRIKRELDTLKVEKNNNYKSSEEDIKILTEENDKLKKEQEELKCDFEIVLKSPLTSMENVQTDMFKQIKKKILELMNQHSKDSETELKQCTDKLNRLEQQIKELDNIKKENDDKKELQSKVSELEARISNFVRENEKRETEMAVLRNTNSDVQQQLRNKLEEMSNIVKETDRLKKEIQTLESSLRQKDVTINGLQTDLNLKTITFENRTSLLKAEQHSADSNEFEASLKNQNEKLESLLETTKTENANLQFEVTSLKSQLAQLQSAWEAGGKENEEISNELIDIRNEILKKDEIITFLNSLITEIENYVVHYYGTGIKTEIESVNLLQRPKWLNNWMDKDNLYHRYATSLEKMFKNMFPDAITVDFTGIITEEEINSNIKTYEKLIESRSQSYVLLTSQVETLTAEIKKFKMFDPSVERFIETKRSKRRTFDRDSNQIERSRRSRSRSPLSSQKSERETADDDDDVEIIAERDEIQNMDKTHESIKKIYDEHEEMSKCINIILNRYNNITYQTEIKGYLNEVRGKIIPGTESEHHLNNIVSILDLQLKYLETIEKLNRDYQKCSNVLFSFTPTKNIKTDSDEITTESDRMDQTHSFLTKLVDEHSEISWFINLFQNYTTKELNDNKKIVIDMQNDNNRHDDNRIKLYLKIIDNFLNHETLATNLKNEIDAINNYYTLKDLIYDNETQTLSLSEPIINEIARLRCESGQRLSEITNELFPNIKSCEKRIDKLRKLNMKLNRYRKIFLPVEKELGLKNLPLMKQKEYRIVGNKLIDMINIYAQVQNQVQKLREESTHFRHLTPKNFIERIENIYESRDFYAKYILKILSFQQNLPILNEIMRCVSCKNWIEISSNPYRFQCHQNHIFHNSCLETILKTDLKCPECKAELFPDMNYFDSTKKRSILSSPNKRAKLDYAAEFEDELESKDKTITELKQELERLKDKLAYTDDSVPTWNEPTVFETSGEDRSTGQTTVELVNEKWINVIFLLSVMYYKLYERSRSEKELMEKEMADQIIENLQKLIKRVQTRFEKSAILSLLLDFFLKQAQIMTNRPIDLPDTATSFQSEKEVVDYIISNLRDYYETKTRGVV